MIDISKLNTATKYPSIDTYHHLDNGVLQDHQAMMFPPGEQVIWTEKVDGTNVRVVRMPGDDYWIGSRNEILYAKGDRWGDHREGIVEYLRPIADRMAPIDDDMYIHVYYMEVYGGRIGAQSRQYTGQGKVGHRVFDVAFVPLRIIEDERMTVEHLSRWREGGGQKFATEATLQRFAEAEKMPLVPRLGAVGSDQLPISLAETEKWLRAELPCTRVALDGDGGTKAEGLVLRTTTRSVIAKARFADYAKALNPQPRNKRR